MSLRRSASTGEDLEESATDGIGEGRDLLLVPGNLSTRIVLRPSPLLQGALDTGAVLKRIASD